MMIDVTVKIPEDRVGDFYELVGRWLSGEQPGGEVTDAAAATPQDWTNSDDDLVLARLVWEKFSPHAKALFSLLMDQPGHKVSGEDLAATLDIPNGKSGVAGVLAWPARHCAAVNRVGPWWWEYGPEGDGAYYWVEQDVADLFRKVRN
jgi:Family of unknown function (DUF6416)